MRVSIPIENVIYKPHVLRPITQQVWSLMQSSIKVAVLSSVESILVFSKPVDLIPLEYIW
jgi:hypothetical protein